jgi:hypothetical protein
VCEKGFFAPLVMEKPKEKLKIKRFVQGKKPGK